MTEDIEVIIGGTPIEIKSERVTYSSQAEHVVCLSPSDPFERLLIPLIELQKRKRRDYASEEDIFANFKRNAAMMDLEGYDAIADCLSMVCRKVGRLVNLRGRDPANESVVDNVEDLIVYSILLKGLMLDGVQGSNAATD